MMIRVTYTRFHKSIRRAERIKERKRREKHPCESRVNVVKAGHKILQCHLEHLTRGWFLRASQSSSERKSGEKREERREERVAS